MIVMCIVQEETEAALEDVLKSIRVQEKGVLVQASTLGSLEALLTFLKDSKIPVSYISKSLNSVMYYFNTDQGE